MQVREWMTPAPIGVPAGTSVFQARRLMRERRIRHLLVMEGGQLNGILTDRDVRLNMPSPATGLSVGEINDCLMRLTVGEVMTRQVLTISAGRDVETAAATMLEHRVGALPVLDEGRVIGILTATDLLRALVDGRPGAAPRLPAAAAVAAR